MIWGAGGHAEVVADIIRQCGTHQIAAFVDDITPKLREDSFLGAPLLKNKADLEKLLGAGTRELIVAVGDGEMRLRLAGEARRLGFRLGVAIHPRATLAPTASLGAGSVLAAGAVVNPGAILGENVIINTSASVDHGCVLEDGVHICPGAHLAGKVTVGRGAWIGIGATVIERVRIGEWAFIGAGAVVVADIPARTLARGVPAKVARRLAGSP